MKINWQILGEVRSTVFEKSNFKVKRSLIFELKMGNVKSSKPLIFFDKIKACLTYFLTVMKVSAPD